MKQKDQRVLGWHFVRENRRLGYNDNRVVKAGKTYSVPQDKPLELCWYGLHASKRLIDALQYAPGPVLCRVELIGDIKQDENKMVAYERHVLWTKNIAKELRVAARMFALELVHLWDAPPVVIEFLKTGDEKLRDAAGDAVWASEWNAAGAAWAAMASVRASAWIAVMTSARAAARAAAGDETLEKQNETLTRLVMKGVNHETQD